MRTQGWEHRLTLFVEAAYRTPFKWGSHDCALWSAQWVREATGKDYVPDWEGKYKTAAGAARLMKKRGFSGVEAIADAHLDSKPVATAQRGDLLLNSQGCLGVCHGRHGFFLTATGVTMEGTLACARAWDVA